MRPRKAAWLCALAVTLWPAPPGAEDTVPPGDRLTRTLEVQAHQALLDRIAAPDGALMPFETDGCSGGLSRVWETVASRFPDFAEVHEDLPPWQACCVTHDRAYQDAGGARTAEASYEARVAADASLRACVIRTGAMRRSDIAADYDVTPERVDLVYGLIAESMHLAVRFGGGPCSGLPWRWGYGYPQCSILHWPDTNRALSAPARD